ncbi:hypothetical protein GF326_13325 [Candidatus Bathyarchaeota archaeon]|nr:hypothetical protein [Candidatus Bathyarchaeota archaeon]
MDVSSGFLIIGLLMALAGAILIYKSLRASPREMAEDDGEVRYIGSVPLMLDGGRKWILVALMISTVLIVYLATKSFYPDIIGGVLNG